VKKVYQIATNVSLESGGQRTAVVNLDHYLNAGNEFSSVILTNEKEESDPFVEFRSEKFRFWNYAAGLKKHLRLNVNDIDILHVHGVWMHTQYRSSKVAKKNNIPYVLTPHGMLQPWYLEDKKLKKVFYRNLLLNNIVSNAKILHVITPLEKENLYKLSKHKNIVEIPNFIHYTKLPDNLSYAPQEDYILFLSRIHPGKGMDILFQSMRKMEDKKIKLKIVGSPNEYSEVLKKLSRELGIENRIEFVGAVYGDQKYQLYANAKVFVAPSYSEAIGMVNLEAAACGTPVITTYETGINKEWNNNGGILINPAIDELTAAMNQAVGWSSEERIQRGKILSEYVDNHYSWEKNGHLWNDLYNSL
jgi:glycosyltransferase involved in cell wall biosynthesis